MHTENTKEAPIERVLAAFAAVGCEAEPEGKGYLACCPVHERGAGHNPSCHIEEQPNGKVTAFCRSRRHRCKFAQIAEAVGLDKAAFFPAKPMTAAAKKAAKKRDTEDAAEKARKASEAAANALALLKHAKPASADHPYLMAKQVGTDMLKQASLAQVKADLGYHPKGGKPKSEPLDGPTLLVVPRQDIDRNLITVQVIDGKGRKSFLSGGPTAGTFWASQHMPDAIDHDGPVLLIGEGVATVKSAVSAAGGIGVAALSEGNIEEVAKAIRGRYPEARIVILADVGAEDTCNDVAREIDASVAVPSGPKKTDWNDVAVRDGIEAAKAGIEAATKPAPEPPMTAENVELDPLAYQRTEQGIGKMFADMIRGTAHYVKEWGSWAVWNGRHWQRDERNLAMLARTKEITVAFLDASKKAAGDGDARAEALTKFAVATQKLHFCEAVIEWAKTEPGIAVSAEIFDDSKSLLTFENGTFDLDADEFREHRKEDLNTVMLTRRYDPDAECPLYEKFQSEIQPDREIRAFLQRWKGYTLSGHTSEQKALFKSGVGLNGKSVDTRIDSAVLGGYSYIASATLLIESKNEKTFSGLLDLKGKRQLLAEETPENKYLDARVLKALTGDDAITDRRLYCEHETFQNRAKIVISGNHRLRLRETGTAMRRRVLMVNYAQKFEGAKCDPNLGDKLMGELEGITNYWIAGYREWKKRGLDAPAAIKEESTAYVDSNDTTGPFFASHCEFGPSYHCTRYEMAVAYTQWSNAEGFTYTLGPLALANKLADRGVRDGGRQTVNGAQQRIWRGVRIVHTEELAIHSPK